MRSRYRSECTEWDAQVLVMLSNAMVVTGNMERRKRYAAAIEAIADSYVEKVEGSIENVYDVEVTRKSTATVAAESEDKARSKALDGLDINDGETVDTVVK